MFSGLLAVGLLLCSNPLQQPRDAGSKPVVTGTAIIRGRVTDRDTGAPIAGANVSVMELVGVQARGAVTDADGRYEILQVRAGRATVLVLAPAYRAEYLSQIYDAPEPMSASQRSRGTSLTLKDGEARENVDVGLWRALQIPAAGTT